MTEADESAEHEREPTAIEALPAQLGFRESEELRQLRGEAIAALKLSSEERFELLGRYQDSGREQVERLGSIDEKRLADIGLTVATGLINRDGGRPEAFRSALLDALRYVQGYADNAAAGNEPARRQRLDEVAAIIETACDPPVRYD
jgi:hypothetical protein